MGPDKFDLDLSFAFAHCQKLTNIDFSSLYPHTIPTAQSIEEENWKNLYEALLNSHEELKSEFESLYKVYQNYKLVILAMGDKL